jgi:hypothetical protein
MGFRRGTRHFVDPLAGPLELEGDGFAAAGELVTLVVAPQVQRFLGMTADETAAAHRASSDYREALSALNARSDPASVDPQDTGRVARQASDDLRAVLGRDRFQRLRELSWRVLEGDALLDDDVAAQLELTPKQRADLAAMAEINAREAAVAFREFSRARFANVDQLHERAAVEDATRSRRLLDLLSPAQRRRFEQLQAGTPPTGDNADVDSSPR